MCNPWGYDRPWASLHYMILPGSMPLVSFILFYLAAISICDFWVSPPEPIQEDFHLLGHASTQLYLVAERHCQTGHIRSLAHSRPRCIMSFRFLRGTNLKVAHEANNRKSIRSTVSLMLVFSFGQT